MPLKAAIIPGLRYRDAPAAIDFLCRAFGFERHAVHADPADRRIIQHAQLIREGQMIMLGTHQPADPNAKGRMLHPAEAGGNTMSCYITVAEIDAHAATAEAAGAELVMRPKDQEYGGRGYSALDLEGYVWSFGSYDPWAA